MFFSYSVNWHSRCGCKNVFAMLFMRGILLFSMSTMASFVRDKKLVDMIIIITVSCV